MAEDELHLSKAPIIEALITVNIHPLSDELMPRVQEVAHSIRAEYPHSEPIAHIQFQFAVDARGGGPPQQSATQDAAFGLKLTSTDRRHLVVVRKDGFSFSRLPPYERWEGFRNEARRLWDLYRGLVGPIQILNFGLRYINRVSVPFGEPIQKYLRMYPEIPDNRDGSIRTITSSLMRVESVIPMPEGRLVIQQATLPPQIEGFATLTLDFDLLFSSSPENANDYIWQTLEIARHIKNQLFVDSLTPNFLESFK